MNPEIARRLAEAQARHLAEARAAALDKKAMKKRQAEGIAKKKSGGSWNAGFKNEKK